MGTSSCAPTHICKSWGAHCCRTSLWSWKLVGDIFALLLAAVPCCPQPETQHQQIPHPLTAWAYLYWRDSLARTPAGLVRWTPVCFIRAMIMRLWFWWGWCWCDGDVLMQWPGAMGMMLMCHDGDVLQCNGRALNLWKDPKSNGMVKYYMIHCYFTSYHRSKFWATF